MEYRVALALDSITSTTRPGDFLNQLRGKLWGNGISHNNFDVIIDAFKDEILEKYNELIKPLRDEINNIDIDNSDDVFINHLNKQNVSENFKKSIIRQSKVCCCFCCCFKNTA